MESVATYKLGDERLVIEQDEFADNPLERGTDLGTMYCFSRRWDLGHEHSYNNGRELAEGLLDDAGMSYRTGDDNEDTMERLRKKGWIIEPLYLYDHSGISISMRSFIGRAHHAEWDSGQVGVYVVTPEEIRAFFRVKRVTRKIREQALSAMRVTVDTYDCYLRGDVYGYDLAGPDGQVDSCSGFIGEYNDCGILQMLPTKWQVYLVKEGWRS